MISYREKEMMMVMKFMTDNAAEFSEAVEKARKSMAEESCMEENIAILPSVESYEDIVRIARERGYDTDYRIEDLLSPEELAQLEKEYDEIEAEFKSKTGLNKTDAVFIITAVVLQIVRQVLQPKVNFEALTSMEERAPHDETAKIAKEDYYNQEKADSLRGKAENDAAKGSRYYYAKLEEVADITHVPYDVVNGTKKYGVKISGKNHRVKTLGHDPYLGYFFGTCNILTNTMSLGKENYFRTLHVGKDVTGRPATIAEANAIKMVEYSVKRFNESKATVGLALIKQFYHIKSDEYSKEGIPLPFLQLFMDSDVIKELCESNADYSKLNFGGVIGKQAVLAELICLVISIAHRITITIEENKKASKEKLITKEELLKSLRKSQTLNEVRTCKVIIISESIASIANAMVVGAVEIGAACAENPDLAKEGLKYLDIGGYISTIMHLFKDIRFITKIKKEFIAKGIEENYKRKLDEIMA